MAQFGDAYAVARPERQEGECTMDCSVGEVDDLASGIAQAVESAQHKGQMLERLMALRNG